MAALWAATLSYAPVLLLVSTAMLGSGGSFTAALRPSLAGWLMAHGVPVDTPTDTITLIPLAITAFAGWRAIRAGVQAGRVVGVGGTGGLGANGSGASGSGASGRGGTGGSRGASGLGGVLRAAGAVALAYATIGAITAAATSTSSLTVPWQRAGVTFGGFAFVAALLGAMRHSLVWRRWRNQIPVLVSDAVRTGLAAASLMVAAGAVGWGVALAVRAPEATQVLADYHAGTLGQAGVTLVCLVYLPNAAVWAAAYLLGPGFAVGVDTVVSPGAVVLGPVPGLPLFAGLPSTPLAGAGFGLLGVPVVLAAVVGVLLALREPAGRPAPLSAALLAGPVAGIALHLASLVSAGALGSGRLRELGPHGFQLFVVTSVVVAAGACLGTAVSRLR